MCKRRHKHDETQVGLNWKYIKECGVVDPAFLSYLNVDQDAAKAIGVKIRALAVNKAFLLPETHCC